MNKKILISMGLAFALTATVAAYADTTIYTDGIGRIHFLGRDAANNVKSGANYSNSAEQDLTRRLYEQSANGVTEDATYDQHPLKNYENTFPDSRFSANRKWYRKGESELDETLEKSGKAYATATKGATDYSGQYQYGSTILDNPNNEVKTTAKKHWWNRNK